MQDLLRQASFLFWQYPSLWMPVAIASLLTYGLNLLHGSISHTLVLHFVATHSVLSDAPVPAPTMPFAWSCLFGLIRFAFTLAGVYLHIAALVTISVLIPALVSNTEGYSHQIAPPSGKLARRFLLSPSR
jgi:hypothetical protein